MKDWKHNFLQRSSDLGSVSLSLFKECMSELKGESNRTIVALTNLFIPLLYACTYQRTQESGPDGMPHIQLVKLTILLIQWRRDVVAYSADGQQGLLLA